MEIRRELDSGKLSIIGQFWGSKELSEFNDYIDNLIFEKKNPVVIDLSQLTFINSRGLGGIIKAYSECKKLDIEVVLLKPDGNVKDLVEEAGLKKIMRVVGSEDEI